MNNQSELTFYHAPHTRSGSTRVLLEELGVPYQLHVINLKANTEYEPAYLAVNPMGKVPALKDGDAVITERGQVPGGRARARHRRSAARPLPALAGVLRILLRTGRHGSLPEKRTRTVLHLALR
jgi:hypothetical protein